MNANYSQLHLYHDITNVISVQQTDNNDHLMKISDNFKIVGSIYIYICILKTSA